MKCKACQLEGSEVEMYVWEIRYGRTIPAPTFDTEPEQEIEFITHRCPKCGDVFMDYKKYDDY